MGERHSTRTTRQIRASREAVYRALLDPATDLPPAVAPVDNELGTAMSLDKLAALLQTGGE